MTESGSFSDKLQSAGVGFIAVPKLDPRHPEFLAPRIERQAHQQAEGLAVNAYLEALRHLGIPEEDVEETGKKYTDAGVKKKTVTVAKGALEGAIKWEEPPLHEEGVRVTLTDEEVMTIGKKPKEKYDTVAAGKHNQLKLPFLTSEPDPFELPVRVFESGVIFTAKKTH